MNWKDKRVVITRAEDDAIKTAMDLERKGAIPILYPCIKIQLLSDSPEMVLAREKALAGYYDWVVFTSRNAVRSFFPLPNPKKKGQYASIGPATTAAFLETTEYQPDFTASRSTAVDLAHELPIDPGCRILIPQSAIARPGLKDILKQRGCVVDVVKAYQNAIGTGGPNLVECHQEKPVDIIQFASPSAVDNFQRRIQLDGGSLSHFNNIKFISIGPTTERACIALKAQLDSISFA